ncbi:hypothetical protein ANO11243_096700 [Dothideomycetidae sp. 11243]|nr:hypothetical protein ANO11243_096700 [fungal sp. No.11243]
MAGASFDDSTTIKTYAVETQGMTRPTLAVCDLATNEVICMSRSYDFGRHVVIETPSQPGVPIAEATIPLFGTTVEVDVRGRGFAIEKTGFFNARHTFTTASGEVLSWKGGVADLICLDANDQKVAQLKSETWTGKKKTLEIASYLEEDVLFSALVIYHYARQKQSRKTRTLSLGIMGSFVR